MTELIYYQDPYKKEFEAKVVAVEENRALLDKTIFIAQTNTEPGDFGKINGVKIAGSKKNGTDVWHVFSKPLSLKAGDIVKLELDWSKRLLAMRLHSALHLLAGAIEKNCEKRAVAGAVKGNQAELILKEPLLEEIITRAIEVSNKDIESGLEIKSYWDEKREGFRWTKVGDYSSIPDGGLHVKNAREIGNIWLIAKEIDGGKQKIIISLEQA